MSVTPEGFLICHNVPIARTGWYEYLGKEIGLTDERANQIVKIYRSPEEVFNPVAMASFEGKPSTDNHPSDWVTPENFSQYFRGTVQNIRQGKEEPDLLLGDLIIYDPVLMREIQGGKREVSCGYDCNYIDNGDGTFSQKQIRGNHVAVVESGRAGERIAIKDNSIKITKKEGENKMGNKVKLPGKKRSGVTDFLAALGLKHFATDAEPEEIAEAVDAMAEEKKKDSEDEETAAKESGKEEKEKSIDDGEGVDLEARITKMEQGQEKMMNLLNQLLEGKKEVKPEEAIDEIIEELETPGEHEKEIEQGDEEESVTIPVEEISEDEGLPDAEISEPSERPKNPIPNADSAALLRMAKMMKPIIANMKDTEAKKKAVDSLNAELKRIKKGNGKNGYKMIVQAQRQKAASTQRNSDSKTEKTYEQIENIKYKYNPHYKKQEVK